MSYIGDFAAESTLDFKFTTVDVTGAPITLAGTPVVSAYEDNSLTQITAGITLTVDFDGVTGLHNVRVVATAANGYDAGSNYQLVITTGTVDSVSVVGYVIAQFSIAARSALRPTTAGRTLDVDASGGCEVGSFQSGAITADAIAADAIGASELAQGAAQEIADEILNRNLAGGGSGNTRNVRNALRALRNKVSESAGTLTVTEEDDTTSAWTATVTRTASTDPITAVDPA